MAGAAASGNNGQIKLVATVVGVETNLIRIKALIDPAGATGASTVTVDGNDITLKLKNDGVDITETNAGEITALGASAAAARLATASLVAAATGANTGAAWTGSGGAFVALAGGADGTYGYDDLAGATGDGWTLTNIGSIDQLETVGPKGRRVRATGDAETGATNAVKAAKGWMQYQARRGNPRPNRAIGATGAGEYNVGT